ncbi:MAG: TolC family protein [Ferruginibacter sp.]|nr:TolC family protein [Ferruginibacter sp.]MBU9935816.1 TolC family protein [Ferruginibacter sp.]
MRYKYHLLIVILGISTSAKTQEKWNLLRCVEYAMTNNISVKQTDLQTRIAALQLKQSKLGQLPNLNFSGNSGYNSGRNQDPTSFSLITQSYYSANMQLQSSAEIFNWFSKRNTIAANEWELQAARANTDKLKNDIALTVANAYLQILLAMEQEKIAGVQLQQSQAQLSNTRKLVDAGALPQLNAAELEAQVARDSSTLISAKGNVQQNILNIKAYMALDAASAFEIDTPPVDKIPVEPIADLQPESVYALAIANMPQQKANDFKIKAAQKMSAAAKGDLYPTLSAYGSLGSGFNSRAQEITGTSKFIAPLGTVKVNNVDYDVFPLQPYTIYNYGKTAFFPQLNQNFRQSIGLSLSVPLFNGYSGRTAYERSRINIKNLQLQQDLDNQTLKQNIYQAYNAAMVALQKYNAGRKSLETTERTYGFALKRYEVGMMSTFELITNQNNVFRAKLENALNQFDYVFKMKVLEFYKGQGLKL